MHQHGSEGLDTALSWRASQKPCIQNVEKVNEKSKPNQVAQSTHFCKKLLALSAAPTWAESMEAYLDMSLAFSHSKNLMPSLVYGSRPKWQYAAVSWYFGSRRESVWAMAPGRQSYSILRMLVMSSAVSLPHSPC